MTKNEAQARIRELEAELESQWCAEDDRLDRINKLEAERDKLIQAVADHVTARAEQYQRIQVLTAERDELLAQRKVCKTLDQAEKAAIVRGLRETAANLGLPADASAADVVRAAAEIVEQRDAAKRQAAEAQSAVRANHEWHQNYDEYGGYPDSELCNINLGVIGSLKPVALTAAIEAAVAPFREDAERYRLLRRGQHWSVINGIGDTMQAEALDAAIDAARSAK